MQCAAPGSPPAISLSASPRLTRGEVDRERVRERLDKKKKKPRLHTLPLFMFAACDGGKTTLEQVWGGVGGAIKLHKHDAVVLKQLFCLLIFLVWLSQRIDVRQVTLRLRTAVT